MTRRRSIVSPLAAAALALMAGAAMAQTAATTAAGSPGSGSAATAKAPSADVPEAKRTKDDKLARGDRKFIEEAAGAGMFEVQAAQLATTKATDPEVKKFAAMLVDHHKTANAELTRMASAAGVDLPPAPPRALRNDIDKMGKKSGAEFDREFVKEVGLKAHEKDIKTFEKASRDLKDPQLKSWAANTLPTLKQHLAAAQQLPQAGGKDRSEAASAGSRGATSSMGASGAGEATKGSSTGGGAATGTGGASGANKTGS